MAAKIQRWGNGQGVRLPKHVLAEARLAVGDDVEVRVVEGSVVLVPARRVRGRVRSKAAGTLSSCVTTTSTG